VLSPLSERPRARPGVLVRAAVDGHKAVAAVPPVHGVRGGDGLDFGAAALLDAALAVVGHLVEGSCGLVRDDEVPDFVEGPDGGVCHGGDSDSVSGFAVRGRHVHEAFDSGVPDRGAAGAAPLGWQAIRRYAASSPPVVDGFGSRTTQLRVRATGNRMVDGFSGGGTFDGSAARPLRSTREGPPRGRGTRGTGSPRPPLSRVIRSNNLYLYLLVRELTY